MFQLSLKLDQQDAFRAEAALEGMADAVTWFEEPGQKTISADVFAERWQLDAIFRAKPDLQEIKKLLRGVGCKYRAITLKKLPSTDWLQQNRQSFAPISAGRFYIYPSHQKNIPRGKIGIRMDATTAFGTGHHASTFGCLLALDGLYKTMRPKRILDMGCGTAILAIAAKKLWKKSPILAADIDAEAVKVARKNCKANKTQDIGCTQSRGFAGKEVRLSGPYDLILANILARPLCKMAADMRRSINPGGIVVLSGLLDGQARLVLVSYLRQGFRLMRRIRKDGWSTLVLQA